MCAAGGHLVLGPRSGMKDVDNRLQPERQPGPLADALGGRVEQFYALDETVPVVGDAGQGQASVWAEALSARAADTKVVLRYGPSRTWLSGQPAAIERAYGKGRITYLGALLDAPLMQRFVEGELKDAGVTPAFAAPPDVEVTRRLGRAARC